MRLNRKNPELKGETAAREDTFPIGIARISAIVDSAVDRGLAALLKTLFRLWEPIAFSCEPDV